MQKTSVTFQYHQRTFELVKFSRAGYVEWAVHEYSINGRGAKVFGFTDAAFSQHQAEHMAKHCLLNFYAGVLEGRKQVKQEINDIIHG